MPDRPEIVCICGSVRFVNEMIAANRDVTFAGAIVVAPGVFPPAEDHDADALVTDEQRTALGTLHLRKIDLADRVLVVNPGGYVGESTSREIAYAHSRGKPVSYTDPLRPEEPRSVGKRLHEAGAARLVHRPEHPCRARQPRARTPYCATFR